MAVSLAAASVAQTSVRLDRDPSSKYPHGVQGARRLIRRAGRRQLAADIARGEA